MTLAKLVEMLRSQWISKLNKFNYHTTVDEMMAENIKRAEVVSMIKGIDVLFQDVNGYIEAYEEFEKKEDEEDEPESGVKIATFKNPHRGDGN